MHEILLTYIFAYICMFWDTTDFCMRFIEGRMRGKPTRGRKRIQVLHNLANDDGYVALKRAAEDREGWKHRDRMSKTWNTTEWMTYLHNYFASTITIPSLLCNVQTQWGRYRPFYWLADSQDCKWPVIGVDWRQDGRLIVDFGGVLQTSAQSHSSDVTFQPINEVKTYNEPRSAYMTVGNTTNSRYLVHCNIITVVTDNHKISCTHNHLPLVQIKFNSLTLRVNHYNKGKKLVRLLVKLIEFKSIRSLASQDLKTLWICKFHGHTTGTFLRYQQWII